MNERETVWYKERLSKCLSEQRGISVKGLQKKTESKREREGGEN